MIAPVRNNFCHVICFLSAVLFPCVLGAPSYGQAEQESRVIDSLQRELKDTWSKRNESVNSLAVVAQMEQVTPGSGREPEKDNDPSSFPVPKNDLISTANLEYFFKLGKMSVLKETDKVLDSNNPGKYVPQRFSATFDTKKNSSLVEQAELPMGTIEKELVPSSRILSNADLLAFGLWHNPKRVLQATGWSYDEMTIEQDPIDVDGVSCRRIRMPRTGGKRWTSAIDVDAENSWLPVQWQRWLDGKLCAKLSIEYKSDKVAGATVKEWRYIAYDDAGSTSIIRRGKVKSFVVNGHIEDSRFSIKFPRGTHVAEVDGGSRKYFIQEEEGLAPIEEKDYGLR